MRTGEPFLRIRLVSAGTAALCAFLMFDILLADLKFALRLLRKSPGFSLVAIATMALGIGANTLIFSIVDAVVLRPLAYRDPTRLVSLHESVPRFAQIAPLLPVNAMHFLEWRKRTKSFEQISLIGGISLSLTGHGEPERFPAARVSANLFPMLGIQARLGRTFTPEEDHPGPRPGSRNR